MKRMFFMSMIVSAAFLMEEPGQFSAKAAKSDTTYIYVYRVGQWNAAGANWAIFLDENKICKLSNNKYMRLAVTPGKHKISAKVGGAGLFKKETEIEIEAEAGGSYYVACNVKQSITRTRLEMVEVTKNSAAKQMEKMDLDKCQENIDSKD